MLPLEELGLYYMLERIHANKGSVEDIVRVGLRGDGLIDSGEPPKLTQAGRERLQALRASVGVQLLRTDGERPPLADKLPLVTG